MQVTDLLIQAGWLMATGMIMVFLFLALLIVAIRIMAHFLAPGEQEEVEKPRLQSRTAATVNKAHIAAISAAISRYKKSRH